MKNSSYIHSCEKKLGLCVDIVNMFKTLSGWEKLENRYQVGRMAGSAYGYPL